ncbi:hypothetical protein [Spiroplasma taiwanense]|uniref:hypothetical protein n=1 Tax=Spiroplasma taiwanense TaxID=2145 RepID=UPI0005A0C35C|nr:hypothetical protein [Spiroplasma taiwanense]
MAEINFYSKDIKNMYIDNFSEVEILQLNQALVMWYTAVFQNRLGVVVLETVYSRALYFVQQYLKQAYENDELYNISFNLIPYDQYSEEIGTYFDANFYNRNNILEDAKIYGINSDTKLLDLRSKNGEILNNNLFNQNLEENVIPIIINEIIAKKAGYQINDIIDIQVLKDEVYQNNKKLTIEDFSKNNQDYFNEYRSKTNRTYYSSSGKSFVDNTIPIIGNVEPLSNVNKETAFTSTNTNPIHLSMLEGKTYLTKTSQLYKNFKIVGIQNGYGKPQGWISNDDANEILNYNKIKKYNFKNYFINEWAHLPEFNSIFNEEKVKDFFQNSPEYEDFLIKLSLTQNNKKIFEIKLMIFLIIYILYLIIKIHQIQNF